MTTLSPLQTLPLHVARMIVHHVVGSSRLEFDDVNNYSDGHGPLLLPLLSVCHNLRAVSVFQYSKIFTMRIAPTSYEGSAPLSYWVSNFQSTSFPTHLYAREVYFHLDFLDICRGTAMEVLNRKPFSEYTFPKAWSLVVSLLPKSTILHPVDTRITPLIIESNIREFVRHIKKVAPHIRKVLISVASRPVHMPQIHDMRLGSLVKQLGQIADDIAYKIYCVPMRLDLQPVGLTYLLYADMDKKKEGSHLVPQIARRSASTLQFLHMQLFELEDISPLIQSPDGSYVQYPCLHTLKLCPAEDYFSPAQLPVHPDVVPFPRLRHLNIGLGYCFGDDTPFRGNADRLEYLDLNMGLSAIEMLRTHKVFTPHSHPKLHWVRLGQVSVVKQNLFDTDAAYVQYILSIGPNAPVRDIRCSLHIPTFDSLVPVFGEYANIQVLVLLDTLLSFLDVIELVKTLPLLSDLHSGFSQGATVPDGVTERHLSAYVRKNYSPMGPRFRCWRLKIDPGQDFQFVAKCVLLLALACPNFDYAAVSAANRPLFMAHMKKTIRIDGFKQHAQRLRRLLFGGWRNQITSVKAAKPDMDLMSLLAALSG